MNDYGFGNMSYIFLGLAIFVGFRFISAWFSGKKKLRLDCKSSVRIVNYNENLIRATLADAASRKDKVKIVKMLPLLPEEIREFIPEAHGLPFGLQEEIRNICGGFTACSNKAAQVLNGPNLRTSISAMRLYENAIFTGTGEIGSGQQGLISAQNLINQLGGVPRWTNERASVTSCSASERRMLEKLPYLPYSGNSMLLYLKTCRMVDLLDVC